MHHGLKIQGNSLQSPSLKSMHGLNGVHLFTVFFLTPYFAFDGVLGFYVGVMIMARDKKSHGIP